MTEERLNDAWRLSRRIEDLTKILKFVEANPGRYTIDLDRMFSLNQCGGPQVDVSIFQENVNRIVGVELVALLNSELAKSQKEFDEL